MAASGPKGIKCFENWFLGLEYRLRAEFGFPLGAELLRDGSDAMAATRRPLGERDLNSAPQACRGPVSDRKRPVRGRGPGCGAVVPYDRVPQMPYHDGKSDGLGGCDPYKLLGVPRSASTRDVRLAYRKVAARMHPDRISEADKLELARQGTDVESAFARVNAAYAVLSDRYQRGKFHAMEDVDDEDKIETLAAIKKEEAMLDVELMEVRCRARHHSGCRALQLLANA